MQEESKERHVHFFRNGRNQALRIPREFEMPGKGAILRKEGHRLIIEPEKCTSLLALLDSWDPLDVSFPDVDDLPPPEEVEI